MTEAFTSSPEQLPYPDLQVVYDDGWVDAGYKLPGTTTNIDALFQKADDDPTLGDVVSCPPETAAIETPDGYSATFCVQTADGQRIVFNRRFLSDNHKSRSRLVDLGRIDTSAVPAITVGESWDSPLGRTAPVTAIILPWTNRIDESAEHRSGKGNTREGAEWIQQARANNR
jgi:hypothetical protein